MLLRKQHAAGFAAIHIVYSGSVLCPDNVFFAESLFCIGNDMQMH